MPYKDPEKRRLKHAEYRARTKDKQREYKRRYRAKTPMSEEEKEKANARALEYYRANKERCQKAHRQARANNPERDIVYSAKARAAKLGLEFNLRTSDITIPDTCPVFGIPLFKGKGSSTDNSPSIDRVDNSKGYIRGNVHIISMRANSLKKDATLDELKAIVKYMEENS